MSGAMFELDEDRDGDGSRNSSPAQSPRLSPRDSPTPTSESRPPVIAQPSPVHVTPSALISSTASPSSLQIPTAGAPNVFNTQPQAIARKHPTPFAATPSFPSPLAQAITVPFSSDTSSSESHSDEDPTEALLQVPASPTRSGNATPRRGADQMLPRPRTASPNTSQSHSPASTQKSLSRPESPVRTGALNPGALLSRGKRPSGGAIGEGFPNPFGRELPRKISPIQQTASRKFPTVVRSESGPSSPTGSHRRGSSGSSGVPPGLQLPTAHGPSSPLAFGSPEMEAVHETRARRKSNVSLSDYEAVKDHNLLGLGWNMSGWEGASPNGPKDRGKARENSSQPSSPKISSRGERMSTGFNSPARQRRPSEFLNPSSAESRKMPITGGSRGSMGTAHIPSLSTSASLISPLNPLPSPWPSESEDSAFSPPRSQASDLSSSVSSASAGAMRLNRVPANVRMAAELIKSGPQQNPSPPSGESAGATAVVPTPNPSPIIAADTSRMPPPPLPMPGRVTSPPATARATPPPAMDIGKGLPTLSVPTTPRSILSSGSPPIATTMTSVSSQGDISRKVSLTSMPPPSAFKVPALPASVARASAPVSADPILNPNKAQYRTSLHESALTGTSDTSVDPNTLSTPSQATFPGAVDIKKRPFGIGLGTPITHSRSVSGTAPATSFMIEPGSSFEPRRRSVTAEELKMDIGSVGRLGGDAASHASMIIQSRQAKVSRWRPGSGGKVEAQLPPAFNRSTTTAAPAMLASRREARQNEWGIKDQSVVSAASSPGEDLPPFPPSLHELDNAPKTATSKPADWPSTTLHANAGPSRFATGSTNMDRQQSVGGGSIGGIEWVDWYDCYKGYKEAKIRAEAEAKKLGNQITESVTEGVESSYTSTSNSPTDPKPAESTRGASSTIELASNYEPSIGDVSRQVSRDDTALSDNGHSRRRSMSFRSTLSGADMMRMPLQRNSSLMDKRQTSGGSRSGTDSPSTSTSSSGKRKKNLVNKMEGWWNAVKSNFSHENQPSSHRPGKPSNLGLYPSRRVPSAPGSRRASQREDDDFPIAAPDPAHLAPVSMQRGLSGHSIRGTTSHADLRTRSSFASQTLQEAAPVDSDREPMENNLNTDQGLRPILMGRAPSMVPEEPSRFPSRVPSSLEARRRGGPILRLDLEPNVMTLPISRMTSMSSSGGGNSATGGEPNARQPTDTSSRTSSYSTSYPGPGLTPGTSRWDQTPSPIFPLGNVSDSGGQSRADKEDRPVAPGSEITVASVRRHIQHRLNAAKEACDNSLRKAIDAMTKFADEAKAKQQQQAYDEQALDYFAALSDSPLIDAEDSEIEAEGTDAFSDQLRPRQPSASSRPSSRRPSISRPLNIINSPTARTSMLPASPNRVRRRQSNAPRSFPSQQRLSRHMSLSFDCNMSAASSRSNSRSRSPMPTSIRGLDLPIEQIEENRKFLAALQDIIVLATEVLDSTVNSLLAKGPVCSNVIQKLQKVGQNWDEHDDWPGREWYVDCLMAVANLSRVLDWWQAEKRFWNFDEEYENEPLVFVMKPQGGVREDPAFDRDFGSALSDHRGSDDKSVVNFSEPLVSAVGIDAPSPGPSAIGTAKRHSGRQATTDDDLKFLAEHAQSVNIVMELSLQGEEIQYVNDAILEVIGCEPDEVIGSPITELLAPADASLFSEATETLMADDNNTVQLRFRFEVQEVNKDSQPLQPGPVYIELEGIGMLMRENNEPSHTMWVLRPVPATQLQVDSIAEAAFPHDGIISNEAILCRICERGIVTWFFEKHNETCDAVHRLEAEIMGCNECIHELHQVVVDVVADLEEAIMKSSTNPGGVVFYELPECITQGHENSVPSEAQGVEVRKASLEQIQDVINILATAQAIEVPSVQEDEADLPFNVQRYLSRESEEKLAKITRWQRPATNDRGLQILFGQVEDQLRRKNKAIARMQSTIRYSEKTRHEWEDKVNQILAEAEDGSLSESGSAGSDDQTAQSPTDPLVGPETSPPGHRKIAPQARLPITQSHPQRPSSSQNPSSTLPAIPTPIESHLGTPATAPLPHSSPAPEPSATLLPGFSTLVHTPLALVPTKADSKPVSPLLTPVEQVGSDHKRRASSARAMRDAPLSPRIPSAQSRGSPPSIKDFDIIKPISRGAFGSVYLAKKVATGDYYAIKALKKSDMIAKNQITNVKAERTILMNQASSPYVAKLFYSFQSKDYLYLVMEYLNGGDCASLVKTLGGLPEEWAKNYTAEVVLGLEYLHARNIVHRDIKPDNLLIDSRGHLKLTDFGLSRIGLLNRQIGGPRPAYLRGAHPRRPSSIRNDSISSVGSPSLSPEVLNMPPMSQHSQSYFGPDIEATDESSGSESAGITRYMRTLSVGTNLSNTASPPRFVGTPDYLAPEAILGIGTDDRAVDWWALGVVLYEFIYGIPPFHADTPEKVFDNVVSRRINWHEEEIEVSPEAHDLMDKLMCTDPAKRLGARGAEEVKSHPFFAGINWATITTSEASFVPDVADPESTDYFDSRGATNALHDEETQVRKKSSIVAPSESGTDVEISPTVAKEMSSVMDDFSSQDEFGAFNFKNLPVLKQANDDVIRKLRSDSLVPLVSALESVTSPIRRPRSLSVKVRDRTRRKASDPTKLEGPPSPTTSTSSAASTPSRGAPSASGSVPPAHSHFRRPSELNALDRVKSSEEGDLTRRSSLSLSHRMRAGSGSSMSDKSPSIGMWRKRRQVSLNSETSSGPGSTLPFVAGTPDSLESPENERRELAQDMGDRTLDVLIAEDNPISQKILETLLTRMGCRCICVEEGASALAATMGSVHFDVIICDIHIPVVNGEQVARMIRSTNNHNQNTPIIATTSYEEHQLNTNEGTLFSAALAKPVTKAALTQCLGKLGFVVSSGNGSHSHSTSNTDTIPATAIPLPP